MWAIVKDRQDSLFLTTQWSVVRAAGRDAPQALEFLCRTYWQPLYRFARRSGRSQEDAEDLVQGFFARLLDGNGLPEVDKSYGKFRAYLLAAFKNHIAGEWQKEHRQKRGGFAAHLSLDWQSAETGLGIEIEDGRTPDLLFDQDWARSILNHVLKNVEAEFAQEGKAVEFDEMKTYLVLNSARIPYAELGEKLGLSEGAARVAVHRLRKRYRQGLRREIAGTLSHEGQVEEEMAALFEALRSS